MSLPSPFVTFGADHLAAIGAIAAAAVALPAWARRAKSPKVARGIALVLAGVLLANEFGYYVAGYLTAPPGGFVKEYLPLHICGVATYLTAWMLVRPNQHLFEFAYYWGLGGTAQAVLTPNILEGFPSYWFLRFFITHGGIVIGAVFALRVTHLRPGRGSVLRIMIVSNLYMAVVAAADWLLGANYMFLREPPAGASPFFFLPWPWYILFAEAVALAIFLLLYLPFLRRNRVPPPGDVAA